ncbi:MAG: hypothetical protein GX896_06965 [Clostridiales bacterium]|nr:hypothetical protein [Clostridiales bacterium]
MKRLFAYLFYLLILAGQFFLSMLIYFAIKPDGLIPSQLAVLLFVPTCIAIYWLNIIFDEISALGKKKSFKTYEGKTIIVREVVIPKTIKKILQAFKTIWIIGIIIVWFYYIYTYSLWIVF